MYVKVRLFLLLAMVSIFSAHGAIAQTTCPTGTRPATGADVVLMKAAGINGAVVGMCWNPDDKNVGKSDAEAKQFLITLYTNPGACSQKGLTDPRVEGIQRLDSQFAINLAAMLKAAPVRIGINSAYRTQEAQQCANPKVKSSNHSRGCAVDLGYSQNTCNTTACQWVLANASKYNLVLRMRYSPEWNHIEPISCAGKSTGSVVTTGTYFDTEDANPASYPIVPNSGYTSPASPYPQSFPGAPAPTYAQTPVTSAPFTSPLSPTNTPAPICTPQFSCSNNVMYYQTTSCTTQVYQNCTKGCDGNSCANIATTVGTSTLVKDPETKASSTTAELLDAFANPVTFSSSAVATGTSLAVILNGGTSNDVIALANGSAPATSSLGTITSIQPLSSQQTFTSPDLVNSGASTYAPQSASGVQKVLSDLKATLVWVIGYLKSLSGSK